LQRGQLDRRRVGPANDENGRSAFGDGPLQPERSRAEFNEVSGKKIDHAMTLQTQRRA
jgi:hypothetical protein